MAQVSNKIFLQAGATGRNDGWGDLVTACAAAGLPVFGAASDGSALWYDLQLSVYGTAVKHKANFIPTVDRNGNRFDFDYTIYANAAEATEAYKQNAIRRWDLAEQVIPPELDKGITAVSLENEQRSYIGWHDTAPIPGFTGWSDSLGWQAYYTGQEALRRGYQYMAFGFAGGNPERGWWESAGALAYLRLCASSNGRLGVALHEYSFQDSLLYIAGANVPGIDPRMTQEEKDNVIVAYYNANPDQFVADVLAGNGTHIGRFLDLYDTCDRHGIQRPRVQIKEFGWRERWVPVWSDSVALQLSTVMRVYAQYPEIDGAAIWTTAAGWGDASTNTPNYIPHLKNFTLNNRWNGETAPPPPEVNNMLNNGSFEDRPWLDLPPVNGTVNQQPARWVVSWLNPGAPVWGYEYRTAAGDYHAATVQGVPECRHLEVQHLPPHEQPGGSDPLILDGSTVYKVFSRSGAFGFVGRPSFTPNLDPGKFYRLLLPVRVHWHAGDNPDLWNCAVDVVVDNQVAHRIGGEQIGDRQWYTIDVVIPGGTVDLRLMQLYPNAALDFFIDHHRAELVEVPPPGDCEGLPREQYARRVNVIPSDATEAEALAIFLSGWRGGKQTSGGSYDDAGIGALDNKTAILWNIDADQKQTFLDWYATHYPGTAVEFKELEVTPPPGGGF